MLIWQHDVCDDAQVLLFGARPPESPRNAILATTASVEGLAAQSVCWVKAARDQNGCGFQEIVEPRFSAFIQNEPDVLADGVILHTPRTAVGMRTGDCPAIVLFERNSGRLLITHAGRAAMKPTCGRWGQIENIVTIAYRKITRGCLQPDVTAVITGAICASCFPHNQTAADQALVEEFAAFGPHAVPDRARGTIDLVAIITAQLVDFGISADRITHDGLCTHEDVRLASYRRDRSEERNMVVGVLG